MKMKIINSNDIKELDDWLDDFLEEIDQLDLDFFLDKDNGDDDDGGSLQTLPPMRINLLGGKKK